MLRKTLLTLSASVMLGAAVATALLCFDHDN